MLKISYINPTGLFSYGKSEPISLLDKGLVCLIGINEDAGGDSNASGKTSLFNALCEILYGKNPTGVSGSGAINNVWDQGCASRVEFVSWENIQCRVTFCQNWKDSTLYLSDNDNKLEYTGTTLYYDKFMNGTWVDSRGASKKETRDKIITDIGMSYDRFLSVAYMSYRVGNLFLRGTNKERMDILSGIAGVDDWDNVLVFCRSNKKQYKQQVDQLNSQLSFEQGALSQLTVQLTDLNSKNLEKMVGTYTDILTSKRKEESEWSSYCENIISTKNSKMEESKASPILSEIHSIESEIDKLSKETIVVDASQHTECTNKLNQTTGQLLSFQSGQGSLASVEKCPTCGTKLTKILKNKINKQMTDLNDEITKLTTERAQLAEQVSIQQKELEDAKAKKISDMRLILKEKRDAHNAHFDIFKKEMVELDEKVSQAINTLNTIRNDINQNEGALLSVNRDLERKASIDKEITSKHLVVNSLDEQIKNINQFLLVYNWLISNIPYIKLHKLSQTMGVISDLANAYLASIGDSIRISISSFSEKKSAKNSADLTDVLKSEVQVEITDGAKNIDPRLYSDGEIGRISNAVIRAMRDTALQSGKGCSILLLDEMFSFIDSTNSQKLAQSFSDSAKVGTVIVTDNSGRATDLLNFDSVWIARKKNGVTNLEGC